MQARGRQVPKAIVLTAMLAAGIVVAVVPNAATARPVLCAGLHGTPRALPSGPINLGRNVAVDGTGSVYFSIFLARSWGTYRSEPAGGVAWIADGTFLTIDRQCNLYVAGADGVDRVSPAGAVTVASALTYIDEAAVTDDGTLFARGSDSILLRVSRDGTTSTPLNDPIFGWSAKTIGVDADGRHLLVGEYDTVQRYDPSTGTQERIAGSGAAPAREGRATEEELHEGGAALEARTWQPSGVASDSAGNVYVSVDGRVRRITRDGVIRTVAGGGPDTAAAINAGGDGGPATAASLYAPHGVAPDDRGFYFAAGQELRRVDSDGILTTIAGTPPNIPPPLTIHGFRQAIPERLLDTRRAGAAPRKPGPGDTVEISLSAPGTETPNRIPTAVTVTATEATSAGYVTVWPCGSPRPPTSNLNVAAGGTAANTVLVTPGHDNKVCAFTSGGAHLVVDLPGGFNTFETMPASRVLDTRDRRDEAKPGKPAPGATVVIDIRRKASSVPDDARAVALNITATGATAAGYVTVWPCDQPRPTTSNLNVPVGGTAANLVLTPVGADGTACVFTSSGADVVADIEGWVPPYSDYMPIAPQRVFDTRAPGGGGPIGALQRVDVTVAGVGGVPGDAAGVVLNVTAADAALAGYVRVQPTFVCGFTAMPLTSTFNVDGGGTAAGFAAIPPDAAGAVCVVASGGAHLIVDVVGYYPGYPT